MYLDPSINNITRGNIYNCLPPGLHNSKGSSVGYLSLESKSGPSSSNGVGIRTVERRWRIKIDIVTVGVSL